MVNDLIEENRKVLGLENLVLKYIKSMRIGQTIKLSRELSLSTSGQ